MIKLKYFFQFLCLIFLFFIFKLLGVRYSSIISGKLLTFIGPLFRSQKVCYNNISIAFPKFNNQEKKVQDKVNAKKVKGVPVRGKKDW